MTELQNNPTVTLSVTTHLYSVQTETSAIRQKKEEKKKIIFYVNEKENARMYTIKLND